MSWAAVKIEDVFDVARGGSPRPIQEYITDDPDGINWIMIGDTNEGVKYIETTAKKIKKDGVKKSRVVKEGDFLLTNSMSFGKPYILKTSGCIHDGWLVLSPKDDTVSTDYFYHLLGSTHIKNELKSKAAGAVVKNLNSDIVKNLDINLPPLIEQKRIADILDKADGLRRKRQQAIGLADEFLRAVFLDMFGDPVKNPRGWDVKNLKDLSTKIHSGSTPKGGSRVYVEEGVTFLRSQNVWKKKLVLDDIAYIDKATHEKMKKSSLKNKDILMTKTGRINTDNSSLGRAAMFLGEDDTANINGHVYLIRLRSAVINEFVLHILTSNEYRDYIRSVCVGGIDKRQINKEHLEQFPIICPPVEIQQHFAQCMKVIELHKELAVKSLKKSAELFNCLSQKAFAGKL